jgi:hypothetical protein
MRVLHEILAKKAPHAKMERSFEKLFTVDDPAVE